MVEDKSNYDIAADLGFPPIKSYQDEVAARGYLTTREYRAVVRAEGGMISSRHEVLMSQEVHVGEGGARRKREIKRYHKMVTKVTVKFVEELARIKANATSFKQKQITRDLARGAYESRTFLEATLRAKGIEPAVEISGMKAQYDKWKWLSSGVDPGPILPEESRSPVANKWTRGRRVPAEEAAT